MGPNAMAWGPPKNRLNKTWEWAQPLSFPCTLNDSDQVYMSLWTHSVNTRYSVNQNYVTIITDLTKNREITIGSIGRLRVVERKEFEPKLLSQKYVDHA